jgi:propanediol dehydratase small subunit
VAGCDLKDPERAMQNRPDASTLLDAVASFLMAEVAPKLEADKALQFRMMIAANLATVVAAELRTEDERFAAEAERLKALVPSDTGKLSSPRRDERMAALAELNEALVRRVREKGPDEATLNHLWETAKQTLQVTNPRFDVSESL